MQEKAENSCVLPRRPIKAILFIRKGIQDTGHEHTLEQTQALVLIPNLGQRILFLSVAPSCSPSLGTGSWHRYHIQWVFLIREAAFHQSISDKSLPVLETAHTVELLSESPLYPKVSIVETTPEVPPGH